MTDAEATLIAALEDTTALVVAILPTRLLLRDRAGRTWGEVTRTDSLYADVARLGQAWAGEVCQANTIGAEA